MISDDEFVRINANKSVSERRKLTLPFRFLAKPVISEQVFARFVRPNQDDQELEFHLTKTPDKIFRISLDDLESATNSLFSPVNSQTNSMAFNDRGDQFVVAVDQIDSDHHTFLMFDIQLNTSRNDFEDIRLIQAVKAVDFANDLNSFVNFEFIEGHYYATSLNGTWRLSEAGDVLKVSPRATKDVFPYDNKLYMTESSVQLSESENDGLSWVLLPNDSDEPKALNFVEVLNDQVFSQEVPGKLFELASDDLERLTPLFINDTFPIGIGPYLEMTYTFESYILAVEKQVFWSDELVLDND